MTNHLRHRFGREKIYLMAHSWGTFLGIHVAQRAPDLYHAYIFEHSAHSPMLEELARTRRILRHDVLAGTTHLADSTGIQPSAS